MSAAQRASERACERGGALAPGRGWRTVPRGITPFWRTGGRRARAPRGATVLSSPSSSFKLASPDSYENANNLRTMTVPKNIPNSSIEWRVEPHAHARICVLAPYRHARVKVYELGTPAGIPRRARASWSDDAKIGPHLAQTLAKEGQNHSGVSRVGSVGPPGLRGAGAGAGARVISAFISTPWPGE